jgi:hypothetical protein
MIERKIQQDNLSPEPTGTQHGLGKPPQTQPKYTPRRLVEATDAQWSYLRTLMNEAFVKRYKGGDLPPLDVHHMPTHYTAEQASQDITALKAIKARGWQPQGGAR